MEQIENFLALKLNPAIQSAITDMGFTEPSPIQAKTLPILLGSRTDFIGLAATGTGKTLAFGVPLLERLSPSHRKVQSLVICPTRELVVQVSEQINLLGKHLGVRVVSIYGGADYTQQFQGLKGGAQVVVGTPGRLIDHLKRGRLQLEDVHTVVLDEADEMISMGFREAIETLLERVPSEKANIWLFSATMSTAIRKVADEFLHDPQTVQVNRAEIVPSKISQFYYMTSERTKPEVLCKLIDGSDSFYGIIFCQTKALTSEVAQYLAERGYKVDSLHGDKSQEARETTLRAFRSHKVNILVCTDVAARGLDIKNITHVINYSLPRELDNYVHRIGRTARSGQSGLAMSLVTNSHRHLIPRIEKLTKTQMVEGRLPSLRSLAEKKIESILPGFLSAAGHEKATEVLSEKWREALSNMSAEEVASRFLALKYSEIFSYQPRQRPEGHSTRPPRRQQRPERNRNHDRPHGRRHSK